MHVERREPVVEFTPLTITLVYVVVGGGWVAYSDQLLAAFDPQGGLYTVLATGKGLVYVAGSGGVLYLLVARRERQQ